MLISFYISLAILTIIHFLLLLPKAFESYEFPSKSFYYIQIIKVLILSSCISFYMLLCFSPLSYIGIFISLIVIVIGFMNLKEIRLEDAFLFAYLCLASICFLILSIAFTYAAYSRNCLLPITLLFTDFENSMLLWIELLLPYNC